MMVCFIGYSPKEAPSHLPKNISPILELLPKSRETVLLRMLVYVLQVLVVQCRSWEPLVARKSLNSQKQRSNTFNN